MKKIVRVGILESRFLLRDKMALFFTFFFPFFMLIMFGSIWGKHPGYFGTLIPMLIAMVAVSGGLFGVGIGLTHYRETGVFRRLALTPLSSRTYIFGILLSRFVIYLIESTVLLLLMIYLYKQTVQGSLFSLVFVVILGTISMLSFGTLVVSLVKSTDGAIAVGNILFTPLMFLSGGFIPLYVLPPIMQKIALGSPVYHFITPLQNIVLRGNSLTQEWPSLLFLLLFFIASTLVSRPIFRAQ